MSLAPRDPPDSFTTVVDSDTVPGMGAVGGVAVDAPGNAGSIARVTQDGGVTTFAAGELFACPNGIVFDDRGDHVTKFRGHQVFRLERDGTSRPVAGDGAQAERDGPALCSSGHSLGTMSTVCVVAIEPLHASPRFAGAVAARSNLLYFVDVVYFGCVMDPLSRSRRRHERDRGVGVTHPSGGSAPGRIRVRRLGP